MKQILILFILTISGYSNFIYYEFRGVVTSITQDNDAYFRSNKLNIKKNDSVRYVFLVDTNAQADYKVKNVVVKKIHETSKYCELFSGNKLEKFKDRSDYRREARVSSGNAYITHSEGDKYRGWNITLMNNGALPFETLQSGDRLKGVEGISFKTAWNGLTDYRYVEYSVSVELVDIRAYPDSPVFVKKRTTIIKTKIPVYVDVLGRHKKRGLIGYGVINE